MIDAPGEARSNADVFAALGARLGVLGDGDPTGEVDLLLKVLDSLPGTIGEDLRADRRPIPSFGAAPIQFVDVFPNTADGRIDLFPRALDTEAASGLYRYTSDPETEQYPLALLSPATELTISSTLGELPRPEVKLVMHPSDALARGLTDNDLVRVFNDLGEVHCALQVAPSVRPGTVTLPKGLWRRNTRNGSTGTALVPDTLTDFGGGACFNDARVNVASLARA